MRVLYFTVVPLGATSNGGSLCCRNHVARLAADPNIQLHVVVAGPPAGLPSTQYFFDSISVPLSYQAFRDELGQRPRDVTYYIQEFSKRMGFEFPWERQSLNQSHVGDAVDRAVDDNDIEVLVVDYHPSALFLRLPFKKARTVLITLNREGDFYADLIRRGLIGLRPFAAAVSLARLRRWERQTNRSVDQVIAIGPPDLPNYPLNRPPICLTPYLDQRGDRWTYSATRRIFFVGAVGHHPNLMAVRWLTQKLAPALLAIGSDIRIAIVGASAADVPEPYQYPNLDLLGLASDEIVSQLFRSSDLMICPIENDYGVKFKSLEALAYGIPLLASWQTMAGLPHLHGVSSLELDDPEEAANLIASLIDDSEKLVLRATTQQKLHADFIDSQHRIWSRTLGRLLER